VNTDTVAVAVVPSAAEFDAIDIRLIVSDRCSRASFQLQAADGASIWHRELVLPKRMSPIRITLHGSPIAGSAGHAYRLVVAGCSAIELAPRVQLRTPSSFSFDNPVAPAGPLSDAISVYERGER
jgi:hypothetical protein